MSAETQEKDWTIMIYMAGDNNLSEDMITALKGMIGIRNAKINLVALYDGSYPTAPIKFYDFSKTRTMTTQPGSQPKLEDFSDESFFKTQNQFGHVQNARNPSSDLFKVFDFVPRVIQKYPAKKFALILSGHSDGVIGKTLLRDENPEISLSLRKLRYVLLNSLPRDAQNKVKKLDLIGFDGCLMGMLEVGYELKSVAKVLVASQGNIPTTGWAYEQILSDVMRDSTMDEKQFAVSIVNRYAKYNVDYTVGGRSVNVSACDLDPKIIIPLSTTVQNLAKKINEVLNLPVEPDLAANLSEEAANINKIVREKFIDWIILSHYKSQNFMHGQATDIIDFLYNLLLNYSKWLNENKQINSSGSLVAGLDSKNKTENEIELRIRKIFKKFVDINDLIKKSKYVVASCSIGSQYQFSNGVSIFFPWTRLALNMLYDKYKILQFNGRKDWLNLLIRLTNLTMRTAPKTNDKSNVQILFTREFKSLQNVPYNALIHKEVGGKEVGGREVIGKEVGGRGSIEEFYAYFSQLQNYDPDVFDENCSEGINII